jgi:phenylpropionate dioxygenase-like ring-hydroxylating dioxygenase large terminal subunit
VTTDHDAASPAETLAGARLPFDPSALVFRERVHYAVDANWKIAVENYLECYHCPVAHPGFSALVDVDPDAYVLEESGEVWSQYGSARDGDGRGKRTGPWSSRCSAASSRASWTEAACCPKANV